MLEKEGIDYDKPVGNTGRKTTEIGVKYAKDYRLHAKIISEDEAR